MKSKYMNNGGQKLLGQLGNQKQHRLDPPPREYMTQQPLHQLQFRRPKPYQGKPEPLNELGNMHKESRRKEWLRRKAAKRRGLGQLNYGGQSWN